MSIFSDFLKADLALTGLKKRPEVLACRCALRYFWRAFLPRARCSVEGGIPEKPPIVMRSECLKSVICSRRAIAPFDPLGALVKLHP
jgi:hypothetical protein